MSDNISASEAGQLVACALKKCHAMSAIRKIRALV